LAQAYWLNFVFLSSFPILRMFSASQGFGYGDAAAPTQQAPKAARQEEKQTCIPVTVRIVQDAVARHAESQEILIHGTEANIVHIVGVVEGLVEQTAMIEFQLNDGSGRMKVRYYTPSGSSEGATGITTGRYISVVGNVRTSPAAHVSAMSLQAVTSADEVSYHMIEVAHAALKLRNPTTAATLGAAVPVSDPITPAKQGLGFGQGFGQGSTVSPVKMEAPFVAAPVAMQTPPKADLRSAVMDLLRQMQESAGAEGLGLSTIAGRTQASSEKVKDILSSLVDEGEVFTTIDDDHFAVL